MKKHHPHFLRQKAAIEHTLPGCQIKDCTKHATVKDGKDFYCAGCATKNARFREKYFVKGGQYDGAE